MLKLLAFRRRSWYKCKYMKGFAKHCCLLLFLLQGVLWGQTPRGADLEVSDSRAVNLLQMTKEKMDKWSDVTVDFVMTTTMPDQTQNKQTGKLYQQGTKYRLELPDRTLVCDGQSMWSYLRDANEIQIQDAADVRDEGYATPLDWLKIYDDQTYFFALVDQIQEKGQTLDLIEFKSKARDEEVSKARLSLDPLGIPRALEIFYRDGVRMILQLNTLKPNQQLAASLFKMDVSKYPDAHVEDLRF